MQITESEKQSMRARNDDSVWDVVKEKSTFLKVCLKK